MNLQLQDYMYIGLYLLPLLISVMKLVAAKTNNTKIHSLLTRAEIIVSALQQESYTNAQKKDMAMMKMVELANELKIKVTVDQLSDYVESAVRTVKRLEGGQNG